MERKSAENPDRFGGEGCQHLKPDFETGMHDPNKSGYQKLAPAHW